MRAMNRQFQNYDELRKKLNNLPWFHLLSSMPVKFIERICCKKEPHPLPVCGAGSNRFVPHFIAWKSAKGQCDECGSEKKHRFGTCNEINSLTVETEVLQWQDVPRQGTKSDGANPD